MQENEFLRIWTKYGRGFTRFLPAFIDNIRTYKTGGKPSRGPLGAVFNASARCDAECPFCGYWRADPLAGNELSTKDKLRVIEELAGAGVWLLSFCGAEPLLMHDLEELIAAAKKRGLLVNISTNGGELQEKAPVLIRNRVDTVTVSIDSKDPYSHDKIRGYKGLYDRLSKGIARIREDRRGKRPRVIARHLVHSGNYLDIQEFVRAWYGRVDEIIFKPIMQSRDGTYKVPRECKPRPSDRKAFSSLYNKLLTSYPFLATEYHKALPDILFGEGPAKSYSCLAGTFFADIDCAGNLYPCAEYGRKEGNILEEGFMPLWSSGKMAEFRKYMKSLKRCRGCWGDKFSSGITVQKLLEFIGGTA
ncbi:MAG: radical SAM protein [Candidatus Omnitrophica bacterium]|nr:radical SAM protein [Candidatus Omnitrophota bacterium]